MTLSPAATAAKAALDAKLRSSAELINVKLGVDLYREMWDCGFIAYLPYDRIVFSGAFPFPSYGHGRFTFWDVNLAPYQFVVGDGGIPV